MIIFRYPEEYRYEEVEQLAKYVRSILPEEKFIWLPIDIDIYEYTPTSTSNECVDQFTTIIQGKEAELKW